MADRGERDESARRARSCRGTSGHLRRCRSCPAKNGKLPAGRAFQSGRAIQKQSGVRSKHRFAARDARRAVHRLRLDRADTLQTQRHRQKNSWPSRNRDAEFRGHPARTTDRRTTAIEVSNFSEASERRSVVWNFASVVRPERGTVSRADRVRSRET